MATAVPPPSRAEIISLFRSLLRSAREFSDYNIREYTKRRTIDAFRVNKTLSSPSSIAAAFADGKSQLQVEEFDLTNILRPSTMGDPMASARASASSDCSATPPRHSCQKRASSAPQAQKPQIIKNQLISSVAIKQHKKVAARILWLNNELFMVAGDDDGDGVVMDTTPEIGREDTSRQNHQLVMLIEHLTPKESHQRPNEHPRNRDILLPLDRSGDRIECWDFKEGKVRCKQMVGYYAVFLQQLRGANTFWPSRWENDADPRRDIVETIIMLAYQSSTTYTTKFITKVRTN
ncbi:hypothetical protein OSB04_004170 [Centaurea solstitialis]|uniref:Complex 1 LYR protein domain-containing protein n=1 Tax=Centaurea solstitialis TaxID=347529 RepID=A0AA38WVI1_9ASTR|nr:hypothetical protein OSB04_004170 [Centaurea solstitialis]